MVGSNPDEVGNGIHPLPDKAVGARLSRSVPTSPIAIFLVRAEVPHLAC